MKRLSSLGTLVLSMVLLSLPVQASALENSKSTTDSKSTTITEEIEGNNEQSNAQEVPYNHPNPNRIASSSDWSGGNVLKGVLKDKNDVDWYKVYVPNGNRTIFSINAGSGKQIHFRILDEKGMEIKNQDFTKPAKFMGLYPFDLEESSGQYYFVEITSTGDSNLDYKFTLGDPNYQVGTYTYKAPKPLQISNSKKRELVTAKYDLSKEALNFPNEAKVYNFTFTGKKHGSIIDENRYVKWPTNSSWTKTKSYVWISEMSPNLNNYLKNTWELKLEGKSSKGFTLSPELRFSCIYPITPDNVKCML